MSERFERGALAISDEEMAEARGSFPTDYMDDLVNVTEEEPDAELLLDIARDLAEFAMEPYKVVDLEAASRDDMDRMVDVLCREDQLGRKEIRLAFAKSLRENCAGHLHDRYEEARDLAILILSEKVKLNGFGYF